MTAPATAAVDHRKHLARIVLYLSALPRHTVPDTGKRVLSRVLFTEARALLPASYPFNEGATCIEGVYYNWKKKNAEEWQRMMAEAERDPENYFADIVS